MTTVTVSGVTVTVLWLTVLWLTGVAVVFAVVAAVAFSLLSQTAECETLTLMILSQHYTMLMDMQTQRSGNRRFDQTHPPRDFHR